MLLPLATTINTDDVLDFLAGFADNLLALVALTAVVWKIAVPHLKRFVQENAANQAVALDQLTNERPDTLAGRAKTAAATTARLEKGLDDVLSRLRPLEAADLPARVDLIEVEQRTHGTRINELERVTMRELADNLRAERAERAADQARYLNDDQIRADRIRDRRRAERENREEDQP